jgi:high affinity cAMP-specific and IBMX-insensitive 3',5'-cyclic phosphodiesterase 8
MVYMYPNFLDRAVLESHHVASTFKLIHSDSLSHIFEYFSKKDYKAMRKLIISHILATDMAQHFSEIGQLK